MEAITIEHAERTLRDHIEWALSHAGKIEEPVVDGSGPLPCDDPPNDDPDRARVSLDYATIVEGSSSVQAARAMEQALEEEGWNLLQNKGAPEAGVMFSASRDGYTLAISASRKEALLNVGGESPCGTRGDA